MSLTGDGVLTAGVVAMNYNDGSTVYTYDSMVVDGQQTVIVQMVVGGSDPGSGICDIGNNAFSSNTGVELTPTLIDSETPSADAVMTALSATGYWKCSDSGSTLAATTGSAGTIVGSPTLQVVGGLFNEPFGGYAITLAEGKYLRCPTGAWLASLDTGVWLTVHFKNSSTADMFIAGFRTAGFADGFSIGFNEDRVASSVPTNCISLTARDVLGVEIVNTYRFGEGTPRFRDGKWHTLTVYIKGGSDGGVAAVMKLWLDGLLLTPEDETRPAGYDFTAIQQLAGDLVVNGYVAGTTYTSDATNSGTITVQRVAIGTGLPSEANVTALSQTLYFVDDYGVRREAFWKVEEGYAFVEDDFTDTNIDNSIFRVLVDRTGNGYHLVPNAYSETNQVNDVPAATPDDGLPVAFQDESLDGHVYMRVHNIFASTLYSEPVFRYCAMDLMPGIGGTCVEALLNFDAVFGSTQIAPGGQGEQRMFTFGAGVGKGSVGFQDGRPKQATTTENPVDTPFPIIRCAPTISYCMWCGGADANAVLANTLGKFMLDGTTELGTDSLAGTYTAAELIGGSTVFTFSGGEGTGGKFGFSGRVYRMGLCSVPWTDTERAAAWTAHKAEFTIPDKPEWVIFNGGDSISAFNLSMNQIGYAQLLRPGGAAYNGSQWRDGALYINAVHGVRLDDTATPAAQAIGDFNWLVDEGYAYGLDNTTRFTAIWFLGTNDYAVTAEDPALSLAQYALAVAEFDSIVPVGSFVQHVGLTLPTLGQGANATRTDINAGLSGVVDRVVLLPDYTLYTLPHPNDTGFAEIAAAINNDADDPMGWVTTDDGVVEAQKRSMIPILIASGVLP